VGYCFAAQMVKKKCDNSYERGALNDNRPKDDSEAVLASA